jgi:folate-binding protein YgfZ
MTRTDDTLAARTGCALVPLPPPGCIELTGADARKFLHGQCTQEVASTRPGEGGYAFLLDPRGRNLGDVRFVVRDDGILLLLDRDRAAATAARLERFVITADVRIADLGAAWSGVLLTGPRAHALLASLASAALPAAEHHAAQVRVLGHDLLVVADRVAGEDGFDLLVRGAPPAIELLGPTLVRAGATPLAAEALEVLRIEAGRPRFGVDLDETVLPEESGLGALAVSYSKGCYSGQEVVAKQKYLGRPRKLLAGFLLERAVALPATVLDAAGQEAGRLTSCALSPSLGRFLGLGMLRAPAPEPGARLRARSGEDEVGVEVALLPFVRPADRRPWPA